MNTGYGGGYGSTPAAPPGKVNFGWFSESWSLFTANAGVWIVAALMIFLVPSIIGGLVGGIVGATRGLTPYTGSPGSGPYSGGPVPVPAAGSWATILSGGLPIGVNLGIRVFSLLWTSFFFGGVYQMAVRQVRGQTITFADIFSGGPLFLPMLGFTVLYNILAFIGLLLCILPLFVVIGLLLPAYALIADGTSIGDAFSRSIDAMKQDWLTAAGFAFVLSLLILVSAIPCGLGMLATMPMMWLISALAYRDMAGMPGPPPGNPAYITPQPGVWPPPPTAGS